MRVRTGNIINFKCQLREPLRYKWYSTNKLLLACSNRRSGNSTNRVIEEITRNWPCLYRSLMLMFKYFLEN